MNLEDFSEQEYIARKKAAKAKILSITEYAEHPFATDKEKNVYAFEITADDKKIVFHGGSHTNQKDNELFPLIETVFAQAHPDMVYVEGHTNLAERQDQVRAALQKETLEQTKLEGEGHFTLKLAALAGVDFDSPEPNFGDEIAALVAAGYQKSDIYQFYQFRLVAQYQREQHDQKNEVTDAGCRDYLKPYLGQFREESGWDMAELAAFETQLFSELEITNSEKYRRLVTPVPVEGKFTSVLSEISSRSGDFRDEYIFDQIADGLKKYNSLFIV
jgi:hypothetical protein